VRRHAIGTDDPYLSARLRYVPTVTKPTVLTSLEDPEGLRCVDIFQRADGSFGFKEFRRDPEDRGNWTLARDYSHLHYETKESALRGATAALGWLPPPSG
jgi:hypothetical protein